MKAVVFKCRASEAINGAKPYDGECMKFETARQIQDALETIRKHEILIDTIGRIAEDSRKILADLEHRLNKLEAKKTLTLKP